MLEELGDEFSGNEILFNVIAKDHELSDASYGHSFQTFESIGYTESDRLGKMYTLLLIDIQMPRSKMLS